MSVEESEKRADFVYKILRSLEKTKNEEPVELSALVDKAKSASSAELGKGVLLSEAEIDQALRLLLKRNLIHEIRPDIFSTYLEPEDVVEPGADAEDLAFEVATTLRELTGTFRDVGMLYGYMILWSLIAGTAMFAVGLIYFSHQLTTLVGYLGLAVLIWVTTAWAYVKRGAFEELNLFKDALWQDVADIKFEMITPEGGTTIERLLNLLSRASFYSDRIQRVQKEFPNDIKFDDEVAGKSGKKYHFDLWIYKPVTIWQRLMNHEGFFLIAKVFKEEIGEDDLESFQDSLIDISEKVGQVPHEILAVSTVGFTRLAYGWANRDSSEVSLDPDNKKARSTTVTLVQENPDGSFRIVAG